ncbi:MAG: DEAD/DEAH box helicase [Candidatus Electrothrix sp. YB6]
MHFKEFGFCTSIEKSIEHSGYIKPTQIQEQAIPHLLQGNDLLGLAQTGTGKTAAFILPTLQRLAQSSGKNIRALILTPTRELAEQVHENVRQLGKYTNLRSCTVYGGVSKFSQVKAIKRGVDIVVACPGRLLDHINSKAIDLSGIEMLILDEADQMCDQGFLPDIRRILKHVPEKRQSLVFSATMPGAVRHFVENILSNPVTVQVDHRKPSAAISHALFQVTQSRKTALLKTLLQRENIATALIFTRTKHKAKNLARQLDQEGFRATSLQGNLSQNQRRLAMDGFRSGKFNLLVATDIAARGIDVSGISHVVNYDVPDTVESYTHRTGRTGRAEKTGEAFTFVTPEDARLIRMVEQTLGKKILRRTVEGFENNTNSASSSKSPRADNGKNNGRNNAGKRNSASSSGRRRKNSAKQRAASFDFGLSTR